MMDEEDGGESLLSGGDSENLYHKSRIENNAIDQSIHAKCSFSAEYKQTLPHRFFLPNTLLRTVDV